MFDFFSFLNFGYFIKKVKQIYDKLELIEYKVETKNGIEIFAFMTTRVNLRLGWEEVEGNGFGEFISSLFSFPCEMMRSIYLRGHKLRWSKSKV